jgi:hypothetical protein
MLLVALAAGLGMPAPAVRHEVHITHARIVVEGRTVTSRIRFFREDLERGLRAGLPAGDSLPVPGPAFDSLAARYIATRFVVTADGVRLVPRVTGVGVERGTGGHTMRWYLVEMRAARAIRRASLRDVLLFEVFPDQQNVVAALIEPRSRRRSLYFVPDGAAAQRLVR